MKYFLLLLFPILAFAENFVSPRIVESQAPQAYQMKSECERVEESDCVDIANNPVKVYEVFLNSEDDQSKPIYEAASNVQPCQSPEACFMLLPGLCAQTHMALFRPVDESNTSFEAYCTKVSGYEKKNVKRIQISEAKAALYESEKVLLAQKAAYAVADAAAEKAVNCGKSTQRLLLIRNAQKKLTTAQVKQMVAQYASTIDLLNTGSLVSAQEEIVAVQPDGVLVTEADKSALIAHINGCK